MTPEELIEQAARALAARRAGALYPWARDRFVEVSWREHVPEAEIAIAIVLKAAAEVAETHTVAGGFPCTGKQAASAIRALTPPGVAEGEHQRSISTTGPGGGR